jgi:signal transduction histidine kinase
MSVIEAHAPPSIAESAVLVRMPADPGAGAGGAMSREELAQLLEAFNEVTDRLTLTHESLQSEVTKLRAELQEANREVERSKHLALLGEMAAGIAHEVRNPLGSILLYARMLQQDLAAQPGPKGVADKIAVGVQRLEAVVGDVLAFSRESRLKLIPLDACDVLAAAASTAQGDGPQWHAVQVRVIADPLEIRADPGQIQQVLVNVIRNAAEAMHEHPRPDGGRERIIELDARKVRVRRSDGASTPMVALRVKDTGPGVPPEAAEKLFTPFFTTRASGTGLGLAIVHRIMDAHAGRVSIRNWVRRDGSVGGAVVELLLPV